MLFAFALTASAQSPQSTQSGLHAAAPSSLPPRSAAAPAANAPACACPTVNANYHPQPYTAKQTSTRVQTLADGTMIHQTIVNIRYRDSDGRTRVETTRNLNGDSSTLIQIFDYTTQTRYTWTVGPGAPNVVSVYHARPINPSPPSEPQTQRYYPYKTESLPPQTIDGVYVTGVRTSRIIPAGYEGNDHDVTVTTESWSSPALGLVLRSILDDPRSGKTTTETTDIQQTEPDPSLFKPPAGYQLHENP